MSDGGVGAAAGTGGGAGDATGAPAQATGGTNPVAGTGEYPAGAPIGPAAAGNAAGDAGSVNPASGDRPAKPAPVKGVPIAPSTAGLVANSWPSWIRSAIRWVSSWVNSSAVTAISCCGFCATDW